MFHILGASLTLFLDESTSTQVSLLTHQGPLITWSKIQNHMPGALFSSFSQAISLVSLSSTSQFHMHWSIGVGSMVSLKIWVSADVGLSSTFFSALELLFVGTSKHRVRIPMMYSLYYQMLYAAISRWRIIKIIIDIIHNVYCLPIIHLLMIVIRYCITLYGINNTVKILDL